MLLAAKPGPAIAARALAHYRGATNMTDAMGGLTALSLMGGAPFEEALADFYARFVAETVSPASRARNTAVAVASKLSSPASTTP